MEVWPFFYDVDLGVLEDEKLKSLWVYRKILI